MDGPREPDAWDAAWVLGLTSLAIAAAMGLVWSGAPPVVASIFQQTAFFAVPVLYARRAGLRPFAANGFVPLPFRKIVFIVIASLGTFWLLNGLTHLQEEAVRALGFEKQAEAQAEQIRQGIEEVRKQGAAPALAFLVLIPPLCEETFFRGLVFRGVLSRFGFGVALAGTSILFAFLHAMDVQKVLMVVLGCYFGTLVYLTGSLWSSILAHAVNNFAVLALMVVYKGRLPDFVAPWWMYVLSAIVFALGMTMLALDRTVTVSASQKG